MTEFRLVRQFDGKTSTSESRAYRVETTALMTEQEAMQLMRDLGSPYHGQKYDDKLVDPDKLLSDVQERFGVPAPGVGTTEWGTDYWGDIESEPSEEHAKAVAVKGTKLYSRPPMGQWKLVEL